VLEDVRQWSIRKQLYQFMKDASVTGNSEVKFLDDHAPEPIEMAVAGRRGFSFAPTTFEGSMKGSLVNPKSASLTSQSAHHFRGSHAEFDDDPWLLSKVDLVLASRFGLRSRDRTQQDLIQKLSYQDPTHFASCMHKRSLHSCNEIPFTVEISSWCRAGLTEIAALNQKHLNIIPSGIPSSTKKFLQNNANIIFFMIEIRFETKSFDILRRYSHFLDLFSALEQDFPDLKSKIPNLPRKDRMRSLHEKLFLRSPKESSSGTIIQPPPSSPLGSIGQVDARRKTIM